MRPEAKRMTSSKRVSHDRLQSYFSGISNIAAHIVHELDRVEKTESQNITSSWASLDQDSKDRHYDEAFTIETIANKDYPANAWGLSVKKITEAGELMRAKLSKWSEMTEAQKKQPLQQSKDNNNNNNNNNATTTNPTPAATNTKEGAVSSMHVIEKRTGKSGKVKRKSFANKVLHSGKSKLGLSKSTPPVISVPVSTVPITATPPATTSILEQRAHTSPATTTISSNMQAEPAIRPRLTSKAHPNMVSEYVSAMTKVVPALSLSPEPLDESTSTDDFVTDELVDGEFIAAVDTSVSIKTAQETFTATTTTNNNNNMSDTTRSQISSPISPSMQISLKDLDRSTSTEMDNSGDHCSTSGTEPIKIDLAVCGDELIVTPSKRKSSAGSHAQDIATKKGKPSQIDNDDVNKDISSGNTNDDQGMFQLYEGLLKRDRTVRIKGDTPTEDMAISRSKSTPSATMSHRTKDKDENNSSKNNDEAWIDQLEASVNAVMQEKKTLRRSSLTSSNKTAATPTTTPKKREGRTPPLLHERESSGMDELTMTEATPSWESNLDALLCGDDVENMTPSTVGVHTAVKVSSDIKTVDVTPARIPLRSGSENPIDQNTRKINKKKDASKRISETNPCWDQLLDASLSTNNSTVEKPTTRRALKYSTIPEVLL